MLKQIAVIAVGLGLSQGALADGHDYAVVLGDVLVQASDKHVPALDDGYGIDVRYGRVIDERWSYEAGFLYDAWDAANGDSGFHGGLGLDVLFRSGRLWGLEPFLVGGGGLAYSDLVSGTVKDPRAGLMLDLGAGVMTAPLARIGGLPLSARVQAKANYEHYDRGYVDTRFYAGLQLALSSPAAPAPAPDTVSVVPAAEPAPIAATPPPAPVAEVAASVVEAEPTIETAKEGDTIVLRGVNFETAKATLTLNAQSLLNVVAEQLAKRPGLKIEIGGHTDSVGEDAYNQDLSERRASAVLDYLVAKGIDAANLSSVGYGEGKAVDTNETVEGREKNRRVELKIVSGDQPG